MHRNAANALSLARLPASLVLLALYEPHSRVRLATSIGIALLIVASDILDGKIARRYKISSKLGYILDGLGDRAFHVSIYLIFVTNGILNIYLAWLLIFREVCQYAVRLAEDDWHSSLSCVDRLITKAYATFVQGIFIESAFVAAVYLSATMQSQFIFINILLFAFSLASYSRIAPRLWKAWVRATHG